MRSSGSFSSSSGTRPDRHVAGSSVMSWIKGVAGSVGRTTVRYLKNIPPRLQNKYLRCRNEKKRMPRRTSKNRVYVLIGYTTKDHVDRRYRATKVQNLIRTVLLVLIMAALIFISYKWLNPFGKSDEILQIIGINNIDDLTQEDPFSAAETTNLFNISTDSTGESTSDVSETATSGSQA